MRYAMIMAGGSGTRLWPMSRAARPKQLIPFIEGQTLLEVSAARLQGLVPHEQILICTSEGHREHIRAMLPQFSDEQILGEPTGRDTVNAIGLTAAVLAKRDPDAVFAVLTADHLITPVDAFQKAIGRAFALTEADPNRIMTFSITPTRPDRGFGYVHRGKTLAEDNETFHVVEFIEKPPNPAPLIATGNYGWNSGMFVFAARTLLDAIERYKVGSTDGLNRIAAAWDTPQRAAVLNEVYPTLPEISVDYAIMEPASHDEQIDVCTIPMPVKWTDVGNWDAYGSTLAKDPDGNRANGPTVHLNSRKVTTVTDDPDHTITTIGCDDLIVIHTADATLICKADQVQRVKDMAGEVDEQLR